MRRLKHSPIFKVFAASAIITVITFVVFSVIVWSSFRDLRSLGHNMFRVKELKGAIIHYDEVLTMSANMAAATGDRKWEKRYREYEPKLSATIDELKQITPDVFTTQAAKDTDDANIKLVEKENLAFGFVDNGDKKSAIAILESDEYHRLKLLYSDGMQRIEEYLDKKIENMFKRQDRYRIIDYVALALGIPILLVMFFVAFKVIKTHLDEQVRSREMIKRNENFVNAILENIPNMIFVKDAEQLRFVRINRAGEELLGYSRAELIGKTDYDIFPKEEADFFAETDKRVLRSKELLDISKESIQPNNEDQRILHTKKIPILNGQNEPDYLLGISEDITEKVHTEESRERLERQLQRSQRMEAIGLMAGGVAHDLNNILSGIVGYPDLLLLQLPPGNELRRPIEEIMQAGLRAKAVVSDLLTVARGVACTKETVNLNHIIQEYLSSPESQKIIASYPKITIQEKLEAESPYIFCSSIHIKKILMNLVKNAVEAIDDKGEITITTQNITLDTAASDELHVPAGRYVLVKVRDTGVGISQEDLTHVFEPFYTKKTMKKSGTGLGLAVVWNAMQDHNGTIIVDSDMRGTCFSLYFPLSSQVIEELVVDNKEASLRGNGERVLVVDDEEMLRDIAYQALYLLGYKADSVPSGELALEFVKEQPVDLLVIDMLMDPGMNGYQTYKEIKELYPEQKAIIVSGFSESDEVHAALKLGASQFIKKPYTIEVLAKAVKSAIANKNESRPVES